MAPQAERWIASSLSLLAMTTDWLFENRIGIGALCREQTALPRPACGERVGVRGSLRAPSSWRLPLTRAFGATSPRKRGEVKGRARRAQRLLPPSRRRGGRINHVVDFLAPAQDFHREDGVIEALQHEVVELLGLDPLLDHA